jgi:hypothetical protein
MADKNMFQNIFGFYNRLTGAKSVLGSAKKAERDVNRASPINLDDEKQKKLEAMCEKLFEKKELISAGKLQFLGLGQIKEKVGRKWPEVEKKVYQIIESVISKHLSQGDIFLFYKGDTYVILFAKDTPEESTAKSELIAEEIRHLLFGQKEKAVREIDVIQSTATIDTRILKQGSKIADTIDFISAEVDERQNEASKASVQIPQSTINIASSGRGNDGKGQTASPKAPVQIPQSTINVIPHDDEKTEGEKGQASTRKTSVKMRQSSGNIVRRNEEKKERYPAAEKEEDARDETLSFSYIPLWDAKKNLLTTYLCVARRGESEYGPMDDHEALFEGVSHAEACDMDIKVLQEVMKELNHMEEDGRQMFIGCPVHYETLARDDGFTKYMMRCSGISPHQRRFLIFLLLDFPQELYEVNIQKFSFPLKGNCSALYAQLPISSQTKNFSILHACKFDAVGVYPKTIPVKEKALLESLTTFCEKAKKANIKKTFMLGVPSLSVTTTVVCSDYDILGGTAIHKSVERPDSVYRYQYENLFVDLMKQAEN